jgi:hypothetical protein
MYEEELGRLWNETIMAYFKVPFCHMLEGAEENHEILSQDSQCPVRDLSQAPPEYKKEALLP